MHIEEFDDVMFTSNRETQIVVQCAKCARRCFDFALGFDALLHPITCPLEAVPACAIKNPIKLGQKS